MIDRDKVIKGLECCYVQTEDFPPLCEECPYRDDKIGSCEYYRDILSDALALLKAEKKTKVVFKQYDGSIESECGNCGLYLDKAYSRCPKCNKELDWNGG